MEHIIKQYTQEAIELLEKLISIPSVSRDETAVADLIEQQMKEWGLAPKRFKNNLVLTPHDLPTTPPDLPTGGGEGPTILLNAHIDTVKPSDSWTKDPFKPTWEGETLYGLGSNDCGGGLVSLLAAYRILTTPHPPKGELLNDSQTAKAINNLPLGGIEGAAGSLIFVASAEEEVSGKDGFEYVRQFLPPIDVAIVGEPTGMQPAIAEKGLMVVDMVSHGKAGHAARNEGVNAIYEALDDIRWIRDYKFDKVSKLLGPTKMTLTVINAGRQHNVIPDRCEMVIDVRTNEHYTNEEVFNILQQNCKSELKARSFRLSSSHISEEHPLIQRLISMGRTPFGSPTLSDQALMPWPSFKLGPGDSARSHTADEFIKASEIEEAVRMYVELLKNR
ncbi:MAG: M20 family metallo-hydrolase [Bacteroidaceae bacterium]|nr:M20 family metallo-hydrolase [Bacteroidaceae bacterium]